MNGSVDIFLAVCLCVLAATTCGCASSKEQSRNMRKEAVQMKDVRTHGEPEVESIAEEKTRALREMSEDGWNNESDLRDFALKESPKLWQTVQTIRAQVATRRKGLARLRSDLKEFNIKPETDADYRRLQGEIDTLLDGLASVFGSLEQAYIAAKKFELSPASASHEEVMKRALEEGVKEADNAARRYQNETNGGMLP